MILSEEFLKEMVRKFSDEVAEQVFNELATNTQNSNFEDELANSNNENELEVTARNVFELFTTVDDFIKFTDLIIETTSGFDDDKIFVQAEKHLLINTIAYICYVGVDSTDVLDEVIDELEFSLDEDFVEKLCSLGERYRTLLDSPTNFFQDFVGIEEFIVKYKHSFETLAEFNDNKEEIIESCVARLCYFQELEIKLKLTFTDKEGD